MFKTINNAEEFTKAIESGDFQPKTADDETALTTAIFNATETYNEVYHALHMTSLASFLNLSSETRYDGSVNWTTTLLETLVGDAPYDPAKHGYKVVSGCLLYNGIPIHLRNASTHYFSVEVVNPDNNLSSYLSFYWNR